MTSLTPHDIMLDVYPKKMVQVGWSLEPRWSNYRKCEEYMLMRMGGLTIRLISCTASAKLVAWNPVDRKEWNNWSYWMP